MLQLLSSPLRFFDHRRVRPVDWVTALAAPVLCAALQGLAALVLTAKTRPLVEAALEGRLPATGLLPTYLVAAVTALSYPVFFGLLVLAMLALNVMVKNPGPPDRLTEFTALSFYTQVPCGLLLLVIAWQWEPQGIRLNLDVPTAELLSAVNAFRDTLLSDPLPSTGRLLSIYSLIWLASVLSIALKALTRLSTGATAIVAVSLLVICVGGPLVGMVLEMLL